LDWLVSRIIGGTQPKDIRLLVVRHIGILLRLRKMLIAPSESLAFRL
jgi:hypothetical protein